MALRHIRTTTIGLVEDDGQPIPRHSTLLSHSSRHQKGVRHYEDQDSGSERVFEVGTSSISFGSRSLYPKGRDALSIKSIFDADSKFEVVALIETMVTDLVDETKDTAQTSPFPPYVMLPRLALVFLDTTSVSVLDLFLLAKEVIFKKLSTKTQSVEDLQGDFTVKSPVDGSDLKFSANTVLKHGGNILQWLLASLDDDMVAVKAQIPMSGTLTQDSAFNAELLRLGKEASQAATDETTGDRASINESFENLRDILQGGTKNFVEKSSGYKVKDYLFLAHLRVAASTDMKTQDDLSETGMLIWKTNDSKKDFFARNFWAKEEQDTTLMASQCKSFCVVLQSG